MSDKLIRFWFRMFWKHPRFFFAIGMYENGSEYCFVAKMVEAFGSD